MMLVVTGLTAKSQIMFVQDHMMLVVVVVKGWLDGGGVDWCVFGV